MSEKPDPDEQEIVSTKVTNMGDKGWGCSYLH